MPAYGRLVDHDPRSRAYAHAAPAKLVPRTTLWAHRAPVIDQGDIGECTGAALAQCLNADYFAPTLRRVNKGQPLLEADARRFYSLATRLDDIAGNTYPPVDGGSSGLGVCKAGKRLGFLSGYRHALSFTGFLSALQTQPLIVGTAFYTGMEDPTADGLVRPTGEYAGGHEYVILGCDYQRQRITALNSWGPSYGANGRFQLLFNDFQALLADQGDATLPVGVA